MTMSLNSGDKVRVIRGSYTGWEGKVSKIEVNSQRVTLVISVFGNLTVIELRPSEIQLVQDQ
jgi:transcription antitermination factor NusG